MLLIVCLLLVYIVFSWQAQSVRLPLESGTQRLRGFGYAEFNSINDLKEALLLKGEVWFFHPIHLTSPDSLF